MTRAERFAEARYIARVTCERIELVLAQVEALDRIGRRVMLIDWRTGQVLNKFGSIANPN